MKTHFFLWRFAVLRRTRSILCGTCTILLGTGAVLRRTCAVLLRTGTVLLGTVSVLPILPVLPIIEICVVIVQDAPPIINNALTVYSIALYFQKCDKRSDFENLY